MKTKQVIELTREEILRHKRSIILQGILFVILGIIALIIPAVFSLTLEWMVGWLFLIGGGIQLIRSIQSNGAPGYWFLILSSLFSMILGVFLVFQPAEGVAALTLIIALYFLAEGTVKILFAFQLRGFTHWGWILFNGLCSIAIALIVFTGWPFTAMWFIGTLLGVSLIINGLSFIIMATQAHLVSDSPRK
jgi:uncharacterized membrane protein HdeD (DUF308 family)